MPSHVCEVIWQGAFLFCESFSCLGFLWIRKKYLRLLYFHFLLAQKCIWHDLLQRYHDPSAVYVTLKYKFFSAMQSVATINELL